MMTTCAACSVSGSGALRHFRLREARAVVGQVLAHHRDIVVGHGFAGRNRHHLAQQRIVGPRPRRGAGARGLRQHLGEPVADGSAQRLRHELLVVHGAADEGLCRLEPVLLAGELHQRKQQRRGIGGFQRAPQARRFRPIVSGLGIQHLCAPAVVLPGLCPVVAETQSLCISLDGSGTCAANAGPDERSTSCRKSPTG